MENNNKKQIETLKEIATKYTKQGIEHTYEIVNASSQQNGENSWKKHTIITKTIIKGKEFKSHLF